MSDVNTARSTTVDISFDNANITKDLLPYFLSLSYTDCEDGETDDLQISLQDREGIWLESWLAHASDSLSDSSSKSNTSSESDASLKAGTELSLNNVKGYVDSATSKSFGTKTGTFYLWDDKVIRKRVRITNRSDRVGKPGQVTCWIDEADAKKSSGGGGESSTAAVGGGTIIKASIIRQNFNNDGKDENLPCGEFELDDIGASGPPSVITLKASSLSYSSQIRQTKKTKAWESYNLEGIAKEMASTNGMTLSFLSSANPSYSRVEQYNESDTAFLSRLCRNAGLSLKATAGSLVIFDQSEYEKGNVILKIKKGNGSYDKYKFSAGKANKSYTSCRVSYVTPSGALIEGTAKVSDYDAESKNNQQLEIRAKVNSVAEAEQLAAKNLRLHNKFEKTASFSLNGNPVLLAGVCVEIDGFGFFNGKYFITKAKHKVSGKYTTDIELRKVLEGY